MGGVSKKSANFAGENQVMKHMKVLQTYTAKPFIKWVGGKGQLLSQLEAALPRELYDEEFTYIEPFVGGGAMLFFMLQRFPNIRRAVINDINCHLTNTYRIIKEQPRTLVDSLRCIEKDYIGISSEDLRKDFYLSIRKRFNEEQLSDVERATLLIFLNRTCFNGLYRENSKGKFNVPFGRYANPTICNEDVIYADSELLNRFEVEIINGDYRQTAQYIPTYGQTFFYFDPPYRPLSETSSFNTYVKEDFNDESQRELALFCRQLNFRANVKWMLSNADCSAKNPADTFFEDIYDGFNIQRVWASRSVNSVASKRGKLTELLISNYDKEVELTPQHQQLRYAL